MPPSFDTPASPANQGQGGSAAAPKKGSGIVPPGTLINNNYEVLELINAGGMGEVYRGINPLTGDMVAIKIVLQSLAHDTKIATLFRREAKVLCQLSDQAIVRYYNFVHDAELDRFCLIMEFIDGITLLEHARKVAPLTEGQALGLLRRLALGLEQAHKREVIHRDLSPDNVILRGGRIEDAVLIDFGIAKSTEMTEETLHGRLAGKFKYISPEQLGSFGGHIGPYTDMYSLALVIAAGVRGLPIDMGSSIHEAVQNRMRVPDLAGIPGRLRPILTHMLEPDPTRRPPRMTDLIAMLDDPGLIPAEYGAEPVTGTFGGLNVSGSMLGAGLSVPPGPLQRPPGGAAPRSMTGSSRPPATMTLGFSVPPQTVSPTIAPVSAQPPKGRGAGGVIRLVVLLGLLGAGGFVAYDRGLVDRVMAQFSPAAPATDGSDVPVDAAGAEESATPGALTRDGFLAGLETGACSFAARIVAGPEAGLIAGFTATPGVFATLPDAYEAAFDTRPEVSEKSVASQQCPVLDLARAVQALEGQAPVVTLDSDLMRVGGSIVGRISERRGRPVWLVLVTGTGQVHNLTTLLAEQADGSATFSFGLNPGAPGDPAQHLILALATDVPLVSAAAATDGTAAGQLMPLILAEIAGRDAQAGVALAQFLLEP
jgi:serine/threonine-protein kinase